MIGQFNMDNLRLLQQLGYQVEVACNFEDRSVWTSERVHSFVQVMKDMQISMHQIDFPRNPFDMKHLLSAWRQMDWLIAKKDIQEALLDVARDCNMQQRVRLLGFRTDIAELLHAMDLFVLPSLQEGLPVALMEALASGIPCLASQIRGNEDLERYGVQYFDLNDQGQLEQKLAIMVRECMQDSQNRKMLSSNGCCPDIFDLDSSVIAEKIKSVYVETFGV